MLNFNLFLKNMKYTNLMLSLFIQLLSISYCIKEDTKCNGCECQFPITESGVSPKFHFEIT